MSLTALLREIVASHVREELAPYEKKGFDAILGVADTAASDVAREGRSILAEAVEERMTRKLGGRKRPRKPAKAPKARSR
jgi:hypothetical protein